MKSHQYASKRRLTNICCIVVALAFVKLVFAAYLAAGGTLFAFPSPEKESKAQQIAEAEAKRIKAYQDAALNYEDSQRALTQAVASLDSGTTGRQNMDATGTNATGTNATGTNAASSVNNSSFSDKATANFALGNERLASSGSRVSLLPQPKNKENVSLSPENNQAQIREQDKAQKNDVAHVGQNVTNFSSNTISNTASNMASGTIQGTIHHEQNHIATVQSSVDMIERSDMVNDDLVLASASSLTANSARAQMRASRLQEAFASYENTEPHALDNMKPEPSDYAQSTEPRASENVASAPTSSSFFSLVGTAYAAEDVPYTRPDEATSMPLPSPTVQAYSSPDSLEYKQSELNRKEEELLALQQQMNSRLRELNELEGRIGNMVQDASSMQSEKFKHLIETYTNMKARVAAQSLVTLDEDIAVRILSGMKSKQSGEIFSYMDPVQSARLSEAMSQFSF